MPRTHNKKRNVGIIYEQVINFICSRLLDEDKDSAKKAISIIKNNFNSQSQLYKEYKLFKALATTNNVSEQLASSIISEAKKACNHMFDSNKLEKEKSKLIKELNYNFGKGTIFEEKVENYRTYATIQTLLNEWRDKSNNFDKVTEYEIKLHNKLTESVNNDTVMPIKVDNLTYKIMQEMFEKKYNALLNKNQQKLIGLFIDDDKESLQREFESLKENVTSVLQNYMLTCNNIILKQKNHAILNSIKNLNESDLSKNNLQKFLTIAKLKEEILGD